MSKRVGHFTFVLTLTTYADYINEDEMVAEGWTRCRYCR